MSNIKIHNFISIMKPLYASFDEVFDLHKGQTYAELKKDGYRVQIHKTKQRLSLFSSGGNEFCYSCYPDLVRIVENLPTGIFDAEMIGSGKHHKEVFEKVKKRFKLNRVSQKKIDEYVQSGIITEVPLELIVFDTLKFENKTLINLPLSERRTYTENIGSKGVSPSQLHHVQDKTSLENLLKSALNSGEEGLVCKNPDSIYLSGQESTEWIKFKRSEPLDLVIVGVYKKGKDDSITGVLCASYNKETKKYETIAKVSVRRNNLNTKLTPLIQQYTTTQIPKSLCISNATNKATYKGKLPSLFIDPEKSIVLQVKAMNINLAKNWHSCGEQIQENQGKTFSLRIGYSDIIRYDKKPHMATTTQAIKKLYELQGGW